MGKALAFAMLLIHQRLARNLEQQHRQQDLFLSFLDGHVTAEQYERDLDLIGLMPAR